MATPQTNVALEHAENSVEDDVHELLIGDIPAQSTFVSLCSQFVKGTSMETENHNENDIAEKEGLNQSFWKIQTTRKTLPNRFDCFI